MKAIFTNEAIIEHNIPKEWLLLALEIEDFKPKKHYSVKVSVLNWEDVEIDYYDIDYIENKNEVLDYFLNNTY